MIGYVIECGGRMIGKKEREKGSGLVHTNLTIGTYQKVLIVHIPNCGAHLEVLRRLSVTCINLGLVSF